MKEKEIELSVEEIQYLLKGTIHWQDIAVKQRPTQRNATGIRRLGEISSEPSELFNQAKSQDGLRSTGTKEGLSFKNREEEHEHPLVSERNERSEVNTILLGEKRSSRASSQGLEGRGVVLLMAAVGMVTLSTWAYFVFAG